MIEILAPCGGEDVLPAALYTGADAVYLGLSSFSARRNAKNFTLEQLREAVRLCRISGVKVYVALNTLVFDSELPLLRQTAIDIEEIGVDGVIVQDLGAAKVIREAAPTLRLHASTQMTITSPSGAEFARKNGFSRVVLAREMSFSEIENVVRNVDIETEVFVHGALCVSVSGQCRMSAFYGGRSGNRGLCAQPCRLNFSCGGKENVLSLKDLSIVEDLPALNEIGVTSAKIEGRMKRPEYVAAAVKACRDALSGIAPDAETLKAVFSRSGFTRAYFDGSMENMRGVRTKEDVISSSEALSMLRKLYEKPYKRHKVDIFAVIETGKPVSAHVQCGRIEFDHISGAVPEKAVNRAVTVDEVCERLAKMGGTVFEAGEISCSVSEGLSLSASAINSLRREILEKIEEKLTQR